MSVFRKDYNRIANAITTDAMVFSADAILDGNNIPPRYFTQNAGWDTGSEATIITKEIVSQLGLKPTKVGGMTGIGGDTYCDIYTIHLLLPPNNLLFNVEAYVSELPDYDLLIGMDVISQTDFLITNKDNTVFSFRYPSEGNVELKEQREEKQC